MMINGVLLQKQGFKDFTPTDVRRGEQRVPFVADREGQGPVEIAGGGEEGEIGGGSSVSGEREITDTYARHDVVGATEGGSFFVGVSARGVRRGGGCARGRGGRVTIRRPPRATQGRDKVT